MRSVCRRDLLMRLTMLAVARASFIVIQLRIAPPMVSSQPLVHKGLPALPA
jgi:hypothetical protein